MMSNMTVFGKIAVLVLVVGAIGGILYYLNSNPELKDMLVPESNVEESTPVKEHVNTTSNGKKVNKLVVGINTWGGFAGAILYNNGFDANEQSNFYKNKGIFVEFKKIDDFVASRQAWSAGEIDVLGFVTVDAFTTEVNGFKSLRPQIIGQIDWSRGGDAIVVRRGINTINDLKNKTIAVAPMTPSHTLLLWLLSSNDLSWGDVQIKEVSDGMAAADLFKKKQVDAALVWAPDDQDCIAQVAGSKVLLNTKTATNIIADVWLVKENVLEAKEKELTLFLEGVLEGNAEINSSNSAKLEAANLLSVGFEQNEEFCLTAINNVRLSTYGDNINFFGLNKDFEGVTGEELYNSSADKFSKVSLNDGTPVISGNVPSWKTVSNSSLLQSIDMNSEGIHAAEKEFAFSKPTAALATAKAVSSKKLTITFDLNSAQLDDNAKYIIDNSVVSLAKGFGKALVRIEGNTDSSGDYQLNKKLSLKRAQSVANYLISEHGFSKNRFVAILGNGPDKPIPGATDAQNRRTDFEFVVE